MMEDTKKIRYAARAVIVDDEGKVAILDVNNGEYFKIPGGGIEVGESIEEALRREAREEGGCEIEIIRKIGEREFSMENDEINHSTCYLAKRVGSGITPNFTDKEKEENFQLRWMTIEDALPLFENAKPQTQINRNMNERDKGFLVEAREMLRSISR